MMSGLPWAGKAQGSPTRDLVVLGLDLWVTPADLA